MRPMPGNFWNKNLAAICLVLLWRSSAQASLCPFDGENLNPSAKVEAVLSWTHTATNGVCGVVKLVTLDDTSASSLHRLVTTSFGSDNWTWRQQNPGRRGDAPVDAMLPEPANVALAIFGVAFAVPRVWQWKNGLRFLKPVALRND